MEMFQDVAETKNMIKKTNKTKVTSSEQEKVEEVRCNLLCIYLCARYICSCCLFEARWPTTSAVVSAQSSSLKGQYIVLQ